MPISPDQDKAVSDLTARADALQKRTERPEAAAPHGAAVNQAYRIIAELFGGVLVGLGAAVGVYVLRMRTSGSELRPST